MSNNYRLNLSSLATVVIMLTLGACSSSSSSAPAELSAEAAAGREVSISSGIDGKDTSWLWDIDFAMLQGKRVICTGERRLDVAYRIQVQGIDVTVAKDIAAAVSKFPTGIIQVIASYTAFQDLAVRELGITRVQGELK
jgi:hypothetical protein